MPAPNFPTPTTTVAAASPGAAAYVVWILITGLVALAAVIRVVRRPAGDWPHGIWSKAGWILVVVYIAIPLHGYPVPLGAVAAIWRTRRPEPQRPAELPFADGGTWEGK